MPQTEFLTLMQAWADNAPGCIKSPLSYQQSEFAFDRFIQRKHKLVFSTIEFVPSLDGPENFILTINYGGGLATTVHFAKINAKWTAQRILTEGNLDYLMIVFARSGFFEVI